MASKTKTKRFAVECSESPRFTKRFADRDAAVKERDRWQDCPGVHTIRDTEEEG